MKRVWQTADPVALPTGFGVALDTKPLKTPGGAPLCVPFQALATAIAAEWREAGLDGASFGPDDLPLTRLATTAIIRIPEHRAAIILQLAAYAGHDLLCYRAESPAELAQRQRAAWRPWLDRAAAQYGLRLTITTGLLPIPQPPETIPTCTAILAQKDDFALAGLGVAIPALGSFVLGLTFQENLLDADAAFRLAHLDELFQAERWGEDTQAAARRAAILTDLNLCADFWRLCA